jgi:hypothetical protein
MDPPDGPQDVHSTVIVDAVDNASKDMSWPFGHTMTTSDQPVFSQSHSGQVFSL